MKTALVLIDIQNDYFKGGKFELHETQQAANNAALVLESFRQKKLPVIHIQHVNVVEGASFFISETEGAEIHESVKPINGEHVVVKRAPSSFLGTDLKEILIKEEINHLVVCGMMSHMCVDTTVRAAMDHGYSVTLVHDACTTRDLEWEGTIIPAQVVHKTFMASLHGKFANAQGTKDFLEK